MDDKINEIYLIKQQCQTHAQQLTSNGYRTEATKLLMELQTIEADLRRAEDVLTKAYLKADKIRTKWQIM